jgi:SLT domain-containing protein
VDVGGVNAVLGARLEDRGFREFDARVAKADRMEATAKLGAELQDRGFTEFDARVKRADGQTGKAKLVADVDERGFRTFEEKVARIDRLQAEGKLKLDVGQFERAIKEGEARLERLNRKRARAVLNLDARGIEKANVEIASVERNLEHLRRQRAEIKVDVDRSAFDRLKSLFSRGGGRGGGGDDSGLLVGLGGTGGSGRLISQLGSSSLPVLTAAAIAAEGALGALTAAALALGGALAPLVGTLAAVPAAIAGFGQIAGSLFATFSGIPDALKAANEAATKSSVDNTAALQQQRSATEAVHGAEVTHANAQRQVKVAQDQLTAARQQATRQLEDLKNAARDAALAEQGASLSLQEAQQRLAQTLVDPNASRLDIQRAQLDVKQAQQGAREARQEAQRASSDSARAQAGGPEQLPQVVEARRRVADAKRAEAESTRALRVAEEQAAASTSKLSASQSKLSHAMANLSPAGRRFVQFLVGLKPRLRELRDASQEAALPHFQTGIQAAMRNFPLLNSALTGTSRILGQTAEAAGRFIGSRGFGRDFQSITRANNDVLRNLGRAVVPLGKAFDNVAVAAEPFTRWIGRAALELAHLVEHSTQVGRDSGGIERFLRRTRAVIEELASTAFHLGRGLAGMFGAAFPAGNDFLKLLERLSKRFDDWANSARGRNQIKKFLDDARGPLGALGDALVSVARLLKDLVAAPGSMTSFSLLLRLTQLLANTLDFLARIPGIGTVVANIGLLAIAAGRFGLLGASIKGLRDLASGIRGVTRAEAESNRQGLARGLGQRIGGLFRGTAATTVATGVGQDAGDAVAQGLSSKQGRIRTLLGRLFGRSAATTVAQQGEQLAFDYAGGAAGGLNKSGGRIRQALRRIFRRGSQDAAEQGAASGIGQFIGGFVGGATVARFAPWFARLRSIFALGFRFLGPIGAGMLIGELVKALLTDQQQRALGSAIGTVIKGAANLGIKAINLIPGVHIKPLGGGGGKHDPNYPAGELPPSAARSRLLRGPLGGSLEQAEAQRLGRDLTLKERRQLETDTKARAHKAKSVADKSLKDAFREGRAESITYDLSKGINIAGTERTFNRLQSVVRREMDQTKRLIARLAQRWDDPLRGLNLLRGRDPLGLGPGVLRSRDEATRSAKRIRDNIVSVFGDLGVLAGADPLGLGRVLLRSRDDATRSAKRIRANILSVFDDMRVLAGADPLHLGAAILHSRDEATRAAKAIRDNIVSVFRTLPDLVASPTTKMLRIVGSALRALGAGGTGRISASIERIEGKAQGGFTGMLPGYSREDNMIVAVRGGEGVLRPEDHIPWADQAFAIASAVTDFPFSSIGDMFQRTGAAYATGGQVVPKPLAQEVIQRVVRARSEDPPPLEQKVIRRFAAGGVVPAVQHAIDVMTKRFPLRVTSTTGGQHAANSYHYKGEAVDLAGTASVMNRAAAFAKRVFGTQLLEGIHNPNLSIKNGKPVAPSFWGATTWAGHRNHIHLALGGAADALAGLGGAVAERVRARVQGPAGAARDLVAGAVHTVERASNRRMRRAAASETGPSSPGTPAPPGRVRNWLTQALKFTHHFSRANLNALFGRTMQESGGDPRAINLWDSNAKAGHPSKGLLQTIASVFNTYKGRGHGSIWNPVDNAIAAINYMFAKYGHIVGPSSSGYARGGIVGGLRRFARGGLVGGAIQALRSGGAVVSRARPDPNRNRPRPATTKQHKSSKPPKRHTRPLPAALNSLKYFKGPAVAFDRITNADTGTLAQAEETYEVDVDDANVTDESSHYIDQTTNQIQWEWVDKRVAEINTLKGDLSSITAQIGQALSIANTYLPQIALALKALQERRRQILKRARELVARIKSLAQLIKATPKKPKYQKLLNHWHTELKDASDELFDLTGSRTDVGTGGKISDVDADVGSASDGRGLLGLQATFLSGLQDLQGKTGRRGRLHDYIIDRAQLDQELAGLAPDQLAQQATGETGTTAGAAIQNFLSSFHDLLVQYGSNVRPLLSFAGGGIVPGPLGKPVQATVHGGELYFDPRTGHMTIVNKQEPSVSNVTNVEKLVIEEYSGTVVQQEPMTHLWSKEKARELGNLI